MNGQIEFNNSGIKKTYNSDLKYENLWLEKN